MSAIPEAVPLGLASAHYLAAAGDRRALSLALVSAGRRPDAARLCLEAAIAQHDGDLDRCVALFRRALLAAEAQEKAYVVDLLVPIYVTQDRIDEAETLLEADHGKPDFEPARQALKTVCLARRGKAAAARALRREVEAMDCSHSDLIAGRVAQRLALSCFYSHDYDEALEHADRSAHIYTSFNAGRLLATSYSIAYIIHYTVTGEIHEARRIAELMTSAAQSSGDTSFATTGLVAQYEIAAQTGDEGRLTELRALLRKEAHPELYQERFPARIADFMPFAWAGDFDAFRAGIVVVADALAKTPGMKSVCFALQGLALLAGGAEGDARRLSRHALHLAAQKATSSDPAYERHSRRVGRALAGATCLLLGDSVRGNRALAIKHGDGSLENSALASIVRGGDWSDAPLRVRGVARIVAAVRDIVRRSATDGLLTRSELSVLRSLADGMTPAQIAHGSGRAVKTVRNHAFGIMQKLRVNDRLAAVAQARRMGLI
jgi:DNA-binding CsgD family transcriptional regulator/tetratricopeptide (TPR) repeat protein